MKKFMEFTKESWEKTFYPRAKRYWLASVGIMAVAMALFYAGAYADVLALVAVAYIMGMVVMVITLALILATAYWYIDRYSEYRKAR